MPRTMKRLNQVLRRYYRMQDKKKARILCPHSAPRSVAAGPQTRLGAPTQRSEP